MKIFIYRIAGILLLLNLANCNQSDKTKILEQYKYEENTGNSNRLVDKKMDAWLKEGITCYGIVMIFSNDGRPVRAKEVKAKVLSIQPDRIKMEALENVFLNQVKGCTKYSIVEGEVWDEIEVELFQTKEEAIRYIDTNYPGLRMK
jgi:hypothetical protein